MKILFLSPGNQVDYQCDLLFHGLRTIFGADVVDVNKIEHMYKGREYSHLYGKGFTVCGLLDDIPVDRNDILAKIKNRFYDFVVFGSIWRFNGLLHEVLPIYPRERILVIDGEDGPAFYSDLAKLTLYFKRELHSALTPCFPIQFAIPAEKIQSPAIKTTFLAPLDPLDPSTYIYSDEASYYASYRSAFFAKTMRKAGWDCLRHYEIMACGAIPYFQNLEYCPEPVMVNLPKPDLIMAKQLYEYDSDFFQTSAGEVLWDRLNNRIQKVLREQLTTTALAERTLDVALREGKETHAHVG